MESQLAHQQKRLDELSMRRQGLASERDALANELRETVAEFNVAIYQVTHLAEQLLIPYVDFVLST